MKFNGPIAALLFVIALAAIPMRVMAQSDEPSDSDRREAAPSDPVLQLTQVAAGFNSPLYATHAGDGSHRIFLVEQVGKIWILKNGLVQSPPYLDIAELISPGAPINEQGLLGLAFHPNYRNNGVFFINYTDLLDATVVARYQVDERNPDIADAASGKIIIQLSQPYRNHNGGHIEFGPDGYLYIALGDGGRENDPLGAGQNRQILLGSILRIDVDSAAPYAIPPDNPFVDDAEARNEIWAYGLRNPWRFSFDRATDDMYIGDSGEDSWEEVNFEPAESAGGRNYGWNVYEGNAVNAGGEAPNYSPPFFVYDHAHGCSVIGGYVYRGEAIPNLQGVYLFGDYCSGRIWASWLDLGHHRRVIELMDTDVSISSFGEDEAGEVYVIDHGGALYRFDPVGS